MLGSSLRRPRSAWGEAFALLPWILLPSLLAGPGKQPCPLDLKLWCHQSESQVQALVRHTGHDKAKAWA